MRSRYPQTQEDGFQTLAASAADHVDELLHAYAAERDHGLRCWLLELVGLARSAQATAVLEQALLGPDEALADWGRRGLELLGSREARTILWRAAQGGA